MESSDIAQWVVVIIIGLGLVVNIGRGIRTDREKYQDIKYEVKAIHDELSDPNTGLAAISEKVIEMKSHCASVTSGFTEKLSGHERELNGIKGRISKKKAL